MPFADYAFKPFLGLLVTWIALLLGAKSRGVIVAPAVDYSRPMFDVQHLVEEDIFDEPFGDVGGVERFANGDRFVGRVVMAENAARAPLRPGQSGLINLAVKVASIDS